MIPTYDICSRPLIRRLFKAIGYPLDRVTAVGYNPHADTTIYEVHTDLKNTFSKADIVTAFKTRQLWVTACRQIDPHTLQIDVTFEPVSEPDDTPESEETDWLA